MRRRRLGGFRDDAVPDTASDRKLFRTLADSRCSRKSGEPGQDQYLIHKAPVSYTPNAVKLIRDQDRSWLGFLRPERCICSSKWLRPQLAGMKKWSLLDGQNRRSLQ